MKQETRILVTRSGLDGQTLAARLARSGLSVSHYAPVRLDRATDPSAVRRELRDALPADCLVVPSGAALRELARLVDPAGLGPARIVVPGRGSARRAAELGFGPVVFPGSEGTSEQMLALPELTAVDGKRILILAAEGGRRLIEHTLRQRGAEVRRLHVYRRVPVEPSPEILEELAAASDLVTLLASGGALAGLRENLPPSAWEKLVGHDVIAPSARVAALAESAGCRQVTAAAGADDASMLAAFAGIRPELGAMRYPVDSPSDDVEP